MYCPECRAEYVPGFTRCADCDVELVEALPAAKPVRRKPARHQPTDDLVTVFSSYDRGLAAIAESLLRSADIRFSVRGWVTWSEAALPVDLQVLASDADEARRILAELPGPESQP
jgi:Putative prokaryotic signal transducing protein